MDGQPYFFDAHIFEDDYDGRDEKDRPPEPEFTRDELEHAKRAAFEEGKKAGFKESESGITQKTRQVFEKIERNMAVLFAAEDDRNRNYETDAVQLCLSIMRKVFPAYTKKYGGAEIKDCIAEAMTSHNMPERIIIELHGDVLEKAEEELKEMEQSLHKHITLRANPSFGIDQCHIHWPDGGIVCNRKKIAEKTVNLIKETLAERGIKSHDEDEFQDLSSATPQHSDTQNGTEQNTGETS